MHHTTPNFILIFLFSFIYLLIYFFYLFICLFSFTYSFYFLYFPITHILILLSNLPHAISSSVLRQKVFHLPWFKLYIKQTWTYLYIPAYALFLQKLFMIYYQKFWVYSVYLHLHHTFILLKLEVFLLCVNFYTFSLVLDWLIFKRSTLYL